MKKALLAILLVAAAYIPCLTILSLVRPDAVGPFVRLVRATLFYGSLTAAGVTVLASLFHPPFAHTVRRFFDVLKRRLTADRATERDLLERLRAFPSAPLHHKLGMFYHAQERIEEARRHFEAALDLDPDMTAARYRLALCHLARGDAAAAVPLLETVLASDPAHAFGEALLRFGEALEAAARHEEAADAYRRFLEYSGGTAEGYYRHALLLERLGRADEARDALARCLETGRQAPEFRRREDRYWVRMARARLARLR